MRISDWSSDVCSSDLGRGCPRFGLILKTPLPNPSGHRAQLDGVRQAASQWLASGLPYPLPSQGREPKLPAEACPEPVEGPIQQGHSATNGTPQYPPTPALAALNDYPFPPKTPPPHHHQT